MVAFVSNVITCWLCDCVQCLDRGCGCIFCVIVIYLLILSLTKEKKKKKTENKRKKGEKKSIGLWNDVKWSVWAFSLHQVAWFCLGFVGPIYLYHVWILLQKTGGVGDAHGHLFLQIQLDFSKVSESFFKLSFCRWYIHCFGKKQEIISWIHANILLLLLIMYPSNIMTNSLNMENIYTWDCFFSFHSIYEQIYPNFCTENKRCLLV